MTIQKQRSDLFRHWILGLGSGDLIVPTAGAQPHQFDMPNVLFLGRKVREIEDMLRSRQMVTGVDDGESFRRKFNARGDAEGVASSRRSAVVRAGEGGFAWSELARANPQAGLNVGATRHRHGK